MSLPSVALSGLLVNLLKVLFGRARPRLLDQFGAHYFDPLTFGYLNASFPSGHSTTVGAIVGILMIWFPRWSLLIVELGLFFAATRIAAQAHYPSDVVAGFLLGRSFRSRWRAGWPGAAWCFASCPGKSFRFWPAARQENRCRRDRRDMAFLAAKALAGKALSERPPATLVQ